MLLVNTTSTTSSVIDRIVFGLVACFRGKVRLRVLFVQGRSFCTCGGFCGWGRQVYLHLVVCSAMRYGEEQWCGRHLGGGMQEEGGPGEGEEKKFGPRVWTIPLLCLGPAAASPRLSLLGASQC
eukprot:GHVT01077499.1.p1 GENE.GHVT01077499.1~~GHVT01077499.1.p1  ORF type:complete len:124 (+),score=10.46 GHVT01077499.1:189-560(+)